MMIRWMKLKSTNGNQNGLQFLASQSNGMCQREPVGQHRIDRGSNHGRGEGDIRLDEQDDLRSSAGRGDHQRVPQVAEDGVVEEDAEEHEADRHHLLFVRFYAEEVSFPQRLGTRRRERDARISREQLTFVYLASAASRDLSTMK